MRVESSPIRHLRNAAEIALLTAVLGSCNGLSPTPSLSSSDDSFKPIPTETATPYQTTENQVTIATPKPNLSVPTPERQSNTWTPGDVISEGPHDGTVYLTFDDCWQDIAPIVLTPGAKITFFCIGQAIRNVSGQAASMRLAISYGDEFENHTDTHPYMDNVTDIQYVKNQIEAQLKSVRDSLGDPNYQENAFRLPGGDGENNPAVQQAAKEEHVKIFHWSINSGGTSDAYNTSPERIKTIMDNIKAGLLDKNGNLISGQIILMHVRPADETALPQVIQLIKDKGGRLGLIGDIAGNPDKNAVNINDRLVAIVIFPEAASRKEDKIVTA